MPALPNSILQALAQGQTAAAPPLSDAQKALLADAQKLRGSITADMVAQNPNMTAQQLASLWQRNYWSNESEAFSRVMTAMENGTAKLIQQPTDEGAPQIAITAGGHPGYDTLYLTPTDTPNVYQFSTRNQVAGGNIHGVIAADPKTGRYLPVQDYTKQIAYTPGSPGGWARNVLNDLGPLGNIALAVATGGLSIPEQLAAQTAMNLAKGQDFEDALKGAGLAVGGSQLVQGLTNGAPVSGMDLAADSVAGNSLANVGAALSKDAGIAALAPETAAAVTPPVTSGAVAESAIPPVEYAPEVNVGTAAPPAPTGIEALTPELNVGTAAPPVPEYAPEVNVGTAAPKVSDGIAALPAEPALPTSVPSTPMAPANPQDFGATIENGGVAPSTVANPVGTGDPGSAPLDTTSNLPGGNAGAAGSSYVTTPGGGIADITGAGTAAAAAGTGAGSGILPSIAEATGLPLGVVQTLAAGLGISALGNALQPGTVTNAQGSYTGPLANIQYNPGTYTPYTYKPYAGGGAVENMSNANAIGANTGFPMADIQRGAYATPYQQPISQNVVTGDQDTRVDPYTGAEMFASGGIANLGGYSDGGRLLRGPGDGVSDSIPAMIGNKQPARLADGEFVIPARIVSEIGNGSTDAGARKLYEMMDRVQAARRKTTGKGKFAANTKADKYLPT